jgi:hypothetical protein
MNPVGRKEGGYRSAQGYLSQCLDPRLSGASTYDRESLTSYFLLLLASRHVVKEYIDRGNRLPLVTPFHPFHHLVWKADNMTRTRHQEQVAHENGEEQEEEEEDELMDSQQQPALRRGTAVTTTTSVDATPAPSATAPGIDGPGQSCRALRMKAR